MSCVQSVSVREYQRLPTLSDAPDTRPQRNPRLEPATDAHVKVRSRHFDGFSHLMNWSGQHAFASNNSRADYIISRGTLRFLLGLYLSALLGKNFDLTTPNTGGRSLHPRIVQDKPWTSTFLTAAKSCYWRLRAAAGLEWMSKKFGGILEPARSPSGSFRRRSAIPFGCFPLSSATRLFFVAGPAKKPLSRHLGRGCLIRSTSSTFR